MPHHLEVLGGVLCRRLGVVEGVGKADAFDRRLGHAPDGCGRLDAERIEDRRHHVDDVGVLRADLAARLDPLGPADDERVADAAPVGLALPAAERRVAGIRPAPREVIENLRPADFVDGRQVLFDRVRDVVEELALVDRSVRPALGAGAVVRDQHDQRVLVLAEVLEELNELADVVVGVGQEAGEDLHHPRVDPAFVRRERIPVLHIRIVAGEHRVRRG